MGYGRADASYGEVFPYTFTYPRHIGFGRCDDHLHRRQGRRHGQLKGKKIALVYHDSAYGKEPISTLEKLSEKDGFTFVKYPVSPPGIDQKATWLQVRQDKPDWVLMWGWGVMNSTAVKEAAGSAIRWTTSSASGTRAPSPTWCRRATTPRATSHHLSRCRANSPVIQESQYVYGNGKTGHTTRTRWRGAL